ncbi:MAG: argininosuccinate lyase [Planctomycetaceae bacterium]|nr:argininosuccinate lyase [Phycisphaerales bacterium]MCE2653681.1 argininosuccinate lyase [Planctomycetaceae bacterium]
MALWGGRFEGKSDPLFRQFNDSLRFDARLVEADIFGSKAWASALVRAGVLTAQERDRLHAALDALAKEAAGLGAAGIAASGEEDVHSWVESRLIASIGDLGKKLHTGRSRNDQVATDLRLWTAGTLEALRAAVRDVRGCLVELADREREVIVPGYTHLQRGQPVLLAHWALAYFQMLGRDDARFADALERTRVSPLGSGALAGTAFPIDREALAKDLGFSGPSGNSLDAVSDRDFVFETLAACSLCSLHLTRLAEDLILYCSAEFGFVTMDDAVTSGSSLMPQKKNPDAAELIRGKSGRILGAMVSLAMTIKGLPLAYNKDLQEDKEPLFDASDNLLMCLRMLPPVLNTLKVNQQACRKAALGDGSVLATDLADYLVDRGVPFRTAHEAAGRLVRVAMEAGVGLHELPLAKMQAVAPEIQADVAKALTLEASLARRNVLGGTAPAQVAQAIAKARKELQG